ncbi:MAG: SCP2 sterol-binding domain-containing protein [Ruminococcus sp.]|nr:SCP2 sterol-binding domain-containing protein [Ruminococcus sp.]MDE6784932.1 SCP2 sterol-binding domain-containing protein [Ruminococcus sp.]
MTLNEVNTVNELIEVLREMAEKIDVSGANGLAVSFVVKDKDPSNFYVAVNKNGNMGFDIQPYYYNDRDCEITMKMEHLIKLLDGKLDAVAAFTLGKLKIAGDLGKALEFAELIKK